MLKQKIAIEILGITLPLFLLNQVWLGILEGYEQFKKINFIKTFNSSFIVGLPAFFVFFNNSLIYAVIGLLGARLLSIIITFVACKHHIITSGLKLDRNTSTRLLKYGGWITVSNIISPFNGLFRSFLHIECARCCSCCLLHCTI